LIHLLILFTVPSKFFPAVSVLPTEDKVTFRIGVIVGVYPTFEMMILKLPSLFRTGTGIVQSGICRFFTFDFLAETAHRSPPRDRQKTEGHNRPDRRVRQKLEAEAGHISTTKSHIITTKRKP